MNEADYGYLKKRIHRAIGINLDDYKATQMMRRLDGFILRTGLPGVIPYCELLEHDRAERLRLRDFLTINVSEFYRDVNQFETLRTVILPQLLANNRNLSIWSAGCSDGQEPYTVAILLNELPGCGRTRILATDIDQASLDRAIQGGPYKPSETRSLPRSLVEKYFTARGDGYHLNETIRRQVEFKQHNLMQDPFEGNFDLIICRNVVIYFSIEAKQRLMVRFFHSLTDKGILFIGATESMLNAEVLGFQRIFPCFYRKPATSPIQPAVPLTVQAVRR